MTRVRLYASTCRDISVVTFGRPFIRKFAGVDEKDIKVTLDGNQPVISGEKKEETKKDEKDWHVEERRFGSFHRSMSLPFRPEEGAIEAHLDKGVLHLNIKKPAEAAKSVKTIEIKPSAPPRQNSNTFCINECENGAALEPLPSFAQSENRRYEIKEQRQQK